MSDCPTFFPIPIMSGLLGWTGLTIAPCGNTQKTHGFMLVTLDSDFAELAALRGAPPKVAWLRHGNQATQTIERLLRANADAIAAFERSEAACLEIYPDA